MRKYYGILLLALGLFSSCEKVSKLSDDAEIVSFSITEQTEGIILNKDDITISNNIVTIPLDYGRKLFPLTIKANIKFSSTTNKVISVDENPLNLKEITFNDVYTPQTFYLISESGLPHLGQIVLKDKPNANITNFRITEPSEGVSVSIRDNNIRITFEKEIDWSETESVTIKADITKTGEYKDGSAPSSFVFTNSNDKKQITLIADNGDERVWNVLIVPSIENSKFEDWINDMPKGIIRSKGIIWAAENNNDAYMFEQAGKQINITNAGRWYATAPRRVRAQAMKDDPTLVKDWDEEVGDRMIKLVFIGQNLDKEAIIKSLDDCLA